MRTIILLDGGFVKHKFYQAFSREPSAIDIKNLSDRLVTYNDQTDILIRIYFYDSPPLTGQLKKPVSCALLDLSKTPTFLANKQRLEESTTTTKGGGLKKNGL